MTFTAGFWPTLLASLEYLKQRALGSESFN
jgi:hypothetical protein